MDEPKLGGQVLHITFKPLGYYQQQYPSRIEAMSKIYLAGHYTLKEE